MWRWGARSPWLLVGYWYWVGGVAGIPCLWHMSLHQWASATACGWGCAPKHIAKIAWLILGCASCCPWGTNSHYSPRDQHHPLPSLESAAAVHKPPFQYQQRSQSECSERWSAVTKLNMTHHKPLKQWKCTLCTSQIRDMEVDATELSVTRGKERWLSAEDILSPWLHGRSWI